MKEDAWGSVSLVVGGFGMLMRRDYIKCTGFSTTPVSGGLFVSFLSKKTNESIMTIMDTMTRTAISESETTMVSSSSSSSNWNMTDSFLLLMSCIYHKIQFLSITKKTVSCLFLLYIFYCPLNLRITLMVRRIIEISRRKDLFLM